MQKHFEIHTKLGLFNLVDDYALKFFPKGGEPYVFTVQETHRLLNMLYDYRWDIIETNVAEIQRVEKEHERNKAYGKTL